MEEAPNDRFYQEVILNAIPHGMALIDDQYRILYANPAMYRSGNKADCIEGLPCYQKFDGHDTVCTDCPATETFKTGHVAHVTRCCIPPGSKGEQHKVFKISSFPIKKGDNVTQCVISFRDITDIYYLERHKEETMNMLAHDIRNPILATTQSIDNVIQGFYGELDERKSGVMTTTRDTCALLLSMIDDLLDIYRHETGQFHISLSNVDIGQVIRKAADLVQVLAKEGNISLHIEMDPAIPPIMGDRQRLIRTVINLLENAIKYSPVGEGVEVAVKKLGDWVHVRVTNLGKSIPIENLERIFEKYFKAECTSFGGKIGMGIGLSFCRQTIEAHGGRIWAESPLEGLDHGSRFLFTLPVAGTQ